MKSLLFGKWSIDKLTAPSGAFTQPNANLRWLRRPRGQAFIRN